MLSSSLFSAPSRRRATVRWVAIVGALLFLLTTLTACSNTAVPPGDPSGNNTSTAQHLIGLQPGDITQESSDKAQVDEPYAYQLAGWVDQNRIAINFVWLLVTGFLVMFMQAGFALVETGYTRAKNALHTMTMNFMIYGIGIIGFFLVGFAFAFGGLPYVGGGNLGTTAALGSMFSVTVGGHSWGLVGTTGFALSGTAYDVSVIAFFLFQLVFMDTTATIPTGAMAERWRWLPFVIYGFFISMFLYPIYAAWTWGGGWLAQMGTNLGLGAGYADFAGSGVVHSIGGWCALAGAMVLGPRLGKYTKDGRSIPMPGHNQILAILGCFILAFGWFGFNPGSSFGASGQGALRIGIVAVTTMIASGFGAFTAMVYTWIADKKPNSAMMVNGMLAGLVAITAPSGFVGPMAAAIIGIVAGLLVCLAIPFFDKRRIDDPVGAISVHGVNGLWGVLALGIFADGTANYAGYSPKGLLYGDTGQFVAQVIGAAVAFAWAFGMSYVFFKVLNKFIPLRTPPETEIAGLDVPELGSIGYTPDDIGLEYPAFAPA